MKKSLCGILALSLLWGCEKPTEERIREYSETLRENAIVNECKFTPKHTESRWGPVYDFWNDEISFKFHDVTIPDNYKILFEGDHVFTIEGGKDKERKIYSRFSQGAKAEVLYREIFRATYDLTKSEKVLKNREVVDHEFLDAIPADNANK